MARPFAPRFAAYIALVFLLLGIVQLAASLLFYQSIDRQTLSEDHARRVAEMLVVGDRIHAIDPGLTASTMSTRHLAADVDNGPSVDVPDHSEAVSEIAARIVAWEPSLGNRSLRLTIRKAEKNKRDLVGSIQLADGRWLNFRSLDMNAMWPVALRATALTLATSTASLFIGLALLHLLMRPLRRMSDAAEAIGQGRQIDVKETGPADLRKLAHSMNTMQEHIARLIGDQARTFEAISHDLRTPLSRQKVAGELLEDEELSDIILKSVDEMEGLLASLQRFLRAQHLTAEPEVVELSELVLSILKPYNGKAPFSITGSAQVQTFREPLYLALEALVENAVQYGHEAHVAIQSAHGKAVIEITDAGPGIPPEHFANVFNPFFRIDSARSRDTQGFGLGIPTAHRLMMRFDGKLTFDISDAGNLIARIEVPQADSVHRLIK